MAYSESYPIDFRSGGDNVRDAFSKHIQEITKIYGLLNDLERKIKQEVEALSTGKIDVSRISGFSNFQLQSFAGDLPMGRVSGNLDASRVVGTLTGATIPNANVTGLESFVKGLISGGGSEDAGEGKISLNENGYAKFSNGLIIQWGNVEVDATSSLGQSITATFATPFTTQCFGVTIAQQNLGDVAVRIQPRIGGSEWNFGLNDFTMVVSRGTDTTSDLQKKVKVYYMAIGV